MSNNDKPGHPDCHECGGSGTNAASLPCFACHHGANLAARRQRRTAFVDAMADGDLPDGLLATTGQPSPYSAAAVEATVDHLRARIRELEADLSTVRGERDDLHDAARAVVSLCENADDDEGLQQCDCGVRDRVTGSARWRRLVALVKP